MFIRKCDENNNISEHWLVTDDENNNLRILVSYVEPCIIISKNNMFYLNKLANQP